MAQRTGSPLSTDLAELAAQLAGDREGHYYVALLGLRRYGPLDLARRIRLGISYSAVARFQRNTGLSAAAVSDLIRIPARTLARRKQKGALDPEESDRLVRAARVFGRALELFEGDLSAARGWLTQPQSGLGGAVPLELARTDVGTQEVERLIGRIEHGIPS
jgi:putative toxin-antitoxin system antitoxin component (TIGR02293 family)